MTGRWLIAAAAMLALIADGAHATPPGVTVASAGGADSAPVFIAAEEGFYARHGLAAETVLMPLMPEIPPAMVAGSVQFGAINPTNLLAAVAGGIDLVAVAGGSVFAHSLSNIATLAGRQSGIRTPQDFVGKTVGVPGFGALLHIAFRYWLGLKGVDFTKVKFVEVSMASERDLLQKKTVDAVVAIDPVMTQIVDAKLAGSVFPIVPDMPEGVAVLLYASPRGWAERHRGAVAGFRAAIADAVAFLAADPAKARADLGRHIRFPPQVLQTIRVGVQQPDLAADKLGWWVGAMRRQGLISGPIDPAKLILQ